MRSAKSNAAITATRKPTTSRLIAVRQPLHSSAKLASLPRIMPHLKRRWPPSREIGNTPLKPYKHWYPTLLLMCSLQAMFAIFVYSMEILGIWRLERF